MINNHKIKRYILIFSFSIHFLTLPEAEIPKAGLTHDVFGDERTDWGVVSVQVKSD